MQGKKGQGPDRCFVLGPLSRRNKLKCIQEGMQSILTRSVTLTHFQLTLQYHTVVLLSNIRITFFAGKEPADFP